MRHLISQSKTRNYIIENNLVTINEKGFLELELTEYLVAFRTPEKDGRLSFGGSIQYDVVELIEFMEGMTFELVPGYPNTKMRHVDMLVSNQITQLVEEKYTKDIMEMN